MLKCNKVIASNGMGGTLATLEDGRCALVYLKEKGLCIDVFLESFLKWGAFTDMPTEEEIAKSIEIIESVEEESDNCYTSQLAYEYIHNLEFKRQCDAMKIS